mmetsp:Transcript_8535/g.21957  ORF Transcript_8535/g.21957 Transcript_8535/m.21957 type:complete len:228 (+) Transcript_8535:133-816(+)
MASPESRGGVSSEAGSISPEPEDSLEGGEPGGVLERSVEELVAETAADFAPFVQVGENEQLQTAMLTIAEDVNHSLARLEEFHGLVNQIKADTGSFLDDSIPLLQANCDHLRVTFDRISQLEAFVGLVKRNVQQMDDHVTSVERSFALQPIRAITGKISTLFNKMASGGADADTPRPPTPAQGAKAEVPKIFQTKQYFKGGRPDSSILIDPPAGGDGAAAAPAASGE